jgi:hypothetical protein
MILIISQAAQIRPPHPSKLTQKHYWISMVSKHKLSLQMTAIQTSHFINR